MKSKIKKMIDTIKDAFNTRLISEEDIFVDLARNYNRRDYINKGTLNKSFVYRSFNNCYSNPARSNKFLLFLFEQDIKCGRDRQGYLNYDIIPEYLKEDFSNGLYGKKAQEIFEVYKCYVEKNFSY